MASARTIGFRGPKPYRWGDVGDKPYLHHLGGGSTDASPPHAMGRGVDGRKRQGWMGHGVGECITQERRPPPACVRAHGGWWVGVEMSWVAEPMEWTVRPTHAGSSAMRIQPRDPSGWKTIGSPKVDPRCLETLDNNAAPSVISSHAEAKLDVGDSPWIEEESECLYVGTWFHMRCTLIVACSQRQRHLWACKAIASSSIQGKNHAPAEVCAQVPCAIVAILHRRVGELEGPRGQFSMHAVVFVFSLCPHLYLDALLDSYRLLPTMVSCTISRLHRCPFDGPRPRFVFPPDSMEMT